VCERREGGKARSRQQQIGAVALVEGVTTISRCMPLAAHGRNRPVVPNTRIRAGTAGTEGHLGGKTLRARIAVGVGGKPACMRRQPAAVGRAPGVAVRPGDVALQLITSSDGGGVARLAAYIIRGDETRLASQA
jgi:hypothetical protein